MNFIELILLFFLQTTTNSYIHKYYDNDCRLVIKNIYEKPNIIDTETLYKDEIHGICEFGYVSSDCIYNAFCDSYNLYDSKAEFKSGCKTKYFSCPSECCLKNIT